MLSGGGGVGIDGVVGMGRVCGALRPRVCICDQQNSTSNVLCCGVRHITKALWLCPAPSMPGNRDLSLAPPRHPRSPPAPAPPPRSTCPSPRTSPRPAPAWPPPCKRCCGTARARTRFPALTRKWACGPSSSRPLTTRHLRGWRLQRKRRRRRGGGGLLPTKRCR